LNDEELEKEYRQAMIRISKQLPALIRAMNQLSQKIERHIKLG